MESAAAHRDEAAPAFRAPAGSCDCHFHVFGPPERYPYAADLRYRPPLAPLADYLALARRLGIERYVLVQPSAYGRDNACLLDALRELGAGSGRAIVDVDENLPDAEIERLHGLGVRGVRVNVNPVKPPEPAYSETLLPRIRRLEARLAGIGWHLDFLTPGWLTAELMPVLKKLRLDFTLAHLGMFPASAGAEQPGFRQLLELLRSGEGYCWVKLTGVYRMARAPGFADAAPMAQALVAAAPERVIWGSDYPHLSFADRVGSVELFNLLAQWAPDEATRRAILVENPRRLFGF
jgi:predicted TIM-barrel fold metal-dependent hydrolase